MRFKSDLVNGTRLCKLSIRPKGFGRVLDALAERRICMPVTMQLSINFDHVEIAFPACNHVIALPQMFGAVDSAASE